MSEETFLHLSFHTGTIGCVENVFNFLGKKHLLTSIHCDPHSQSVSYNILAHEANSIWESNKDFYNQFSTIIITDTAMLARPFIQNMDHHSLRIVIIVTNRFDFRNIDPGFFSLYEKASHHPRVRFVSDNEYDRVYCSRFGINFFTTEILRTIIDFSDAPREIIHDKLFIYDRGTDYRRYSSLVPVPHEVFGGSHGRFRDRSHVLEYKGFLHLPYQTNVISLWENIGCGVVYFIPSKELVKEWIRQGWYYWEETYRGEPLLSTSLDTAEWYKPELSNLFVYFDSWEDLCEKYSTVDVEEKRKVILDAMRSHNEKISSVWRDLLML